MPTAKSFAKCLALGKGLVLGTWHSAKAGTRQRTSLSSAWHSAKAGTRQRGAGPNGIRRRPLCRVSRRQELGKGCHVVGPGLASSTPFAEGQMGWHSDKIKNNEMMFDVCVCKTSTRWRRGTRPMRCECWRRSAKIISRTSTMRRISRP